MILKYSLFLLLTCSLFILSIQENKDYCVYKLPDGRIIDLNRATKDTYYNVHDSKLNYNFYINICDDAKKQCNGAKYGGIALGPDDACATHFTGPTTESNYKIELLDSTQPEKGVKLTVSGGEVFMGRAESMVVNMNCDSSKEELTFIKEDFLEKSIVYQFNLNSKYGCIVTNDLPLGQFGVGGLLLVLSFVALLLYFIIGGVLLKFKFQKTGIEIIPNVNFWKDLPFLLKDGVMLPVDLIKQYTNKGAYQEV
ncbi:hypothetical protein ABK040_007912 [Willaertia magna]